jgi:hypothetical protein
MSPIDSEKSETKENERGFFVDEEIRNVVQDGKRGYLVRVRLTSYRSLPLSCIEKIELRIDGAAVDPQKISLVFNGQGYKLADMPRLSKVWWFILDYADLFVESEKRLPSGEHLVEGTLVTVEPYVTGGRFSFFYPSQKRLLVAADY